MSQEIWKPVQGFDGYEVSSLGRVASFKSLNVNAKKPPTRHLLSLKRDKGYLRVTFCVNGKNYCRHVHRVVLDTFVGPCPEGMQAAHGDGNRLNNSVSNLRWDTPKNNNADKLKHGTAQRGEKHPHSKLTNSQIVRIRDDKRRPREIAADYDVSRSQIQRIKSRNCWTHV